MLLHSLLAILEQCLGIWYEVGGTTVKPGLDPVAVLFSVKQTTYKQPNNHVISLTVNNWDGKGKYLQLVVNFHSSI